MARLCLFFVGLLVVLSILIPTFAEEQGDGFIFRRRARLLVSECAPVVHYQVQQQAYYAPVVQKVVTYGYQTIVPVPIEQQVVYAPAPVYYWSVSEAYQQKAMMREVLREELRNLGGQPQAIQQPAQPHQQPAPLTKQALTTPSQPNTKTEWTVDDVTPSDVRQEVLAAFQNGCARCHGGGPKDSGGLKLVMPQADGSLALTKLSADKRWKVYAMAAVGAMPPEAATDASKALNSKYLPALLKRATIKD